MKKLQSLTILAIALSASITTVAASNRLLLECKKGQEGQVVAYNVIQDFISGATHLTKTSVAGREPLLKNAYCEFSKIEISCSVDDRPKGGDFKMYTFGMESDGTFALTFHTETSSDTYCDSNEKLLDDKLECNFF